MKFKIQKKKEIYSFIDFYLEEEKAQCYVAASIGPYGAVLSDGSEFNGWYTDSMTIEVFHFIYSN